MSKIKSLISFIEIAESKVSSFCRLSTHRRPTQLPCMSTSLLVCAACVFENDKKRETQVIKIIESNSKV